MILKHFTDDLINTLFSLVYLVLAGLQTERAVLTIGLLVLVYRSRRSPDRASGFDRRSPGFLALMDDSDNRTISFFET